MILTRKLEEAPEITDTINKIIYDKVIKFKRKLNYKKHLNCIALLVRFIQSKKSKVETLG